MHIFVGIGPLKAYLKHQQSNHLTVGLVPTMGALHKGHLSLIQASKEKNDITVCSIYVNPVQFNNPIDLEKYPRTLDTDIQMLKDAGCDVAFCPDSSEMYREGTKLKFEFGPLDKVLEGEFRPGHFSGVALVVAKFFNIVRPQRAYFGQKDFQQFKVISRLVEELKFDLELVCSPIVRESDGLAMSSRNARLNMEDRERAILLSQCLLEARQKLLKGESMATTKRMAFEKCASYGVKIEYLALADREDLTLLESVKNPANAILLMAAYVGDVRLIDNIFLAEN
ncbi:pantoate--beta-alanine ligase [soil metagenome]